MSSIRTMNMMNIISTLILLFSPLLVCAKEDHKQGLYNYKDSLSWITDSCHKKYETKLKADTSKCVSWSTGLEHESFLVHRKQGTVEEYVVNSGSVSTQMYRYGRTFGLNRKEHSVSVYLEHTGVEFSGRACADINDINFKAMVESVTTSHRHLSYDEGFCQLSVLDETILKVVSSSPNEVDVSKTIGDIHFARSGMGADLGIYTRTGGKTHKCSTCGECDLKDYTGSYHISISLPSDENGWVLYDSNYSCPSTKGPSKIGETTNSVWVDAHIDFANMFQWVEPLILAVTGSADAESVLDNGLYVEGSYRTMASGWGVHGTTDVRNFGIHGTGRYSQTGFRWLMDTIQSPYSGLWGCESEGMGADIRTKTPHGWEGADDEMPPLEVGNGIELRVFDNFPSKHLPMVYRFISLLAENSRVSTSESFVYDNESWISSIQSVMKEGWNSHVEEDYIKLLEYNLDVDLSGLSGNRVAFSVFEELFHVLVDKNIDGLWTNILLDDVTDLVHGNYTLSNPNRDSWEIGAINMGITPTSIRKMFKIPMTFSGELLVSDIVDFKFEEDLDDIIYLAETLGVVESIQKAGDGKVYSMVVLEHDKLSKAYRAPVCVN